MIKKNLYLNLRYLLIPLGNTEFRVLNLFNAQSSKMAYNTRRKISCKMRQ